MSERAADRAVDGLAAGERYLALLADDRPAEDYAVLLQEARAAGADAEIVGRLHQLALRARGLREVGRRRESELAALFDTVADLAALKDLDDVLEAIVRRARTLLACDVSYLSLNDDEAGETYMRITQGIHSEEFRRVRLGFGEGLGGLVAQTARPYATADYFSDERFEHTRTIDSAVGSEELTAILGVPLLLGRTVIGVLYAANHDPRPFSREDVDLLTSFAGHAAVALDNARRTEENAAAFADLRRTGELLRQAAEGSQRAADAHDRLANVVLQGGDLGDVAGELQQVLGEPVHVVDAQGTTLATSDPGWAPDEDVMELVRRSLEDNRTHVEGGLSVATVWAGGAPLAAVLVRGEVDDLNRRILERAAGTAALIMVVQRSVAETASRRRGDLLVDLLLGRTGAGALTARASLLGADLSRPHAVLVAAGADPVAVQWATDQAAGAGGLCAEVDDRLVLVLPDRDPLGTGRHVVERARGSGAPPRRTVGRDLPTVGVAGPASGADGVRSAYVEATRCLEALLALGRRGDVADAATLGFVGLLLGRGDPAEHVRARLGPVIDYDTERRTGLVGTLEAWLAEDRRLGRTGERLHVHPNTVTQRLDRVGQLLGPGWQAPDRLLELQLALRLHRVLS
ncbi:helix-turn-helix domain-containing protein [Ornithinimicrobium cerasi]|uniref:helix-turn-helix domain-containing protein n=1 Tax=Ornithinimicrobium cerasi TaxID=2248773 RepID=UPI000EFE8E96|nr:GAF domain-containing protein [Ornithinimicrobium cerasi]